MQIEQNKKLSFFQKTTSTFVVEHPAHFGSSGSRSIPSRPLVFPVVTATDVNLRLAGCPESKTSCKYQP
jgi:hypothetical protein